MKTKGLFTTKSINELLKEIYSEDLEEVFSDSLTKKYGKEKANQIRNTKLYKTLFENGVGSVIKFIGKIL